LLRQRARVDLAQGTGMTALLWACRNGATAIWQQLVKAGADVRTTNKLGENALWLAAVNNHADLVRLVIQKTGVGTAKNREGDALLVRVAGLGKGRVIKVLLDHDQNVNMRGKFDNTALMLAADSGHAEIVEILLAAGASVNAKNVYGNTALMLAAKNGHSESVRLLLDSGADTQIRNKDKHNAAQMAEHAGHKDIVRMLEASAKGGKLFGVF